MNDYIDAVLAGQQSLESFEAEHLISAVQRDTSLTPVKRRMLIGKINTVASVRNQDVMTKVGDGQVSAGMSTQVTGAAATFGMRIVRNSSNILSELPVVLFLSDFVSNEYRQILPNFLPSGVILVSVTTLSDRIRFTYSNGDVSDSVDVFTDTTSYPSFLASMNTTFFKMMHARMKVYTSTAANTNTDAGRQFGVTLTPYKDTAFGAFGGNRFPLTNCEPADQQRLNIIEIPEARWSLSPRQGVIVPVINATAPADTYTMHLGVWVNKFTRTSDGE